jgi:hypothetical protein
VKIVLVMGRKRKEIDRLEYRVFTRISKEKYEELEKLLQGSRCKTISELLRHILENRKIVVEHYDSSLDKVMEQLSGIRKEIQSIGININQVTHYFHLAKEPESKIFNALEIVKLYQQTDLKVTELFSIVAKLSELWLQK